MRPGCCLQHALKQELYRLGQLPRAALEDSCRHEVGTGGTVFAETSKSRHALLLCRAGDVRLEFKVLDTLCVRVTTQTRELALSCKRVSEKVGFALRIQHPGDLAGLERRNAANLGLAFHNFLCLLPWKTVTSCNEARQYALLMIECKRDLEKTSDHLLTCVVNRFQEDALEEKLG